MLPLFGPLGVVTEGELLRDLTPLTGRALGRIDLGTDQRWSVDLGVQVPVLQVAAREASPQWVAQVRWLGLGSYSSSNP